MRAENASLDNTNNHTKGTIAMNRKTILLVLMLAAALLVFSSCGESKPAETAIEQNAEIPVILNQAEYILYQNIFYNSYMSQYEGKSVEKEGVFAKLQDAYSGITRYYVWGYLDQTMCCDWQWEFVPLEADKLPAPGSRVKVSGTYHQDEQALDNFWITNAKVEILSNYTGEQAELNMHTMSDTLERVQLAHMVMRPDKFIGKEYIAYGRIASGSLLEDPYYDGSWNLPYESTETMPAIGTIVVIRGVYQDNLLAEAKLLDTKK